jgi:hypothetical protein
MLRETLFVDLEFRTPNVREIVKVPVLRAALTTSFLCNDFGKVPKNIAPHEAYMEGIKLHPLLFYGSEPDSVLVVTVLHLTRNGEDGIFGKRTIKATMKKVMELSIFSRFSEATVFPTLQLLESNNRKYKTIPLFIFPIFLACLPKEAKQNMAPLSTIFHKLTNKMKIDYGLFKCTNEANILFRVVYQLEANMAFIIRYLNSLEMGTAPTTIRTFEKAALELGKFTELLKPEYSNKSNFSDLESEDSNSLSYGNQFGKMKEIIQTQSTKRQIGAITDQVYDYIKKQKTKGSRSDDDSDDPRVTSIQFK